MKNFASKSICYEKSSPLLFMLFSLTVFFCLFACASTSPPKSDSQASTKQQAVEPLSPAKSPIQEDASSSAVAAPKAIQIEPQAALVLTVKVNLRAEPSDKGKIITRLKKGEKVFKIGASGHWLHVELADKTTGWVIKKQTKEEK